MINFTLGFITGMMFIVGIIWFAIGSEDKQEDKKWRYYSEPR